MRTIVVDVLRGQVRASASAAGGARFEVRLPALPRADARAALAGALAGAPGRAVAHDDGVYTLAPATR